MWTTLTTQVNEASILKKFGLNTVQIKIYITLEKINEGTVQEIAQIAQLYRQQVYQEMPRLLELGVVEQFIDAPNRYKAISIDECISLLNEKRNIEFIELQNVAKEFLKQKKDKLAFQIENPTELVLTKKERPTLSRRDKNFSKSKVSIDLIIPNAGIDIIAKDQQLFFDVMKKGVRIKVLIGKHREKRKNRIAQILLENPLFEIREAQCDLSVMMGIHDGKKVGIVNVNQQEETWSNKIDSSLCTNEKNIVKLATFYFDKMWVKGRSLN